MAFNLTKDADLGAGYRLVERLGAGGYGEVWKATAPGGLAKAVKIVFGDMSGPQAEQELRALGRIKEVRHPFLLSLERIEVQEGHLLIVSELADGSLAERCYECRKAGLPGIPRDELISHIRDAASALDYMADTHGLQHLDIKPQNLLLVGNRIKVADFGLVRGLGGTRNSALALTPIYATPEAFDGRVTRQSDQYSLAIVYMEMLTGVRPFPGSTLMQLAAQHISSQPLLTPLPTGDRPIIARALAKIAEHRYHSCSQMVEALQASRATGSRSVVVVPEAVEPETRPSLGDSPTPPEGPDDLSMSFDVSALRETEIPGLEEAAPRARHREGFKPWPGSTPGIRPTLFLGIGGLAGAALHRLKARLREKHGDVDAPQVFSTLLLDTDREDLRRARQHGASGGLDSSEILLTPLHPPVHYKQNSKELLRWLDRRWLYGIPRSLLTEGIRPLGRLAFVDNAAAVLAQVREALVRITQPEALARAAKDAGVPIRDAAPRIFVVASITGGTGSGMLISLAYALRQALREVGVAPGGLCAILLYATSQRSDDRELARINALATLNELEHFSRPDVLFPGDASIGLAPCVDSQPPFDESYLVSLGDQLDRTTAESATAAVADYLHFQTCPAEGAFFDQFRRDTLSFPDSLSELPGVRSFGLARIHVTGGDSLAPAARALSARLMERWLAEPDADEMVHLHRATERQASESGLSESSLALFLQTAMNSASDRPDAMFPKLLAKAAESAGSPLPHLMLEHVDAAFVGYGNQSRKSAILATPLLVIVQGSAEQQAAEISRSLIGWLIRKIELPGKRFRVAERASALISRRLATLLKAMRNRQSRVSAQREQIRHQITAKAASPGGASKAGTSRAPVNAVSRASVELTAYCRLWLRELAERCTVAVLESVQRKVDGFHEEVVQSCRQLKIMADNLRPAAPSESEPGRSSTSRPPSDGTSGRLNGATASGEKITADQVHQFDLFVQTHLSGRDSGFWDVFSRGQDPYGAPVGQAPRSPEQFEEDLLSAARKTLRAARGEVSTAQRFLENYGNTDKARAALLATVEKARPRLRVEGSQEQLVVVVPQNSSGSVLNEMLAVSLPDVSGSVVRTDEGVALCFEVAPCPLAVVTRTLLGPTQIPDELVRRVMTRLDVTWSSGGPQPVEAPGGLSQ